MAKYGKVRYVNSYVDAPKTAEWIFRRLDDDTGCLQQYTGDVQMNIYECWWEDTSLENFQAMLVEVRKHMPQHKLLYVERPAFMREPYELPDYWKT